MVTITSTNSNSSFNQLQTFNSDNKNNHARDASFSSYLNSNEESFGRKISEPSRNLNPFISKGGDHLYPGEKKEEGEIGVFEAVKYFNGVIEQGSPRVTNMTPRKYLPQNDEQTEVQTRKYRIKSATPSVRSESSWNSQSALLKSALRNSSRAKRKKAQGKSFLAGLGCKCSCSDKSSVDINDHVGENNFNKNAAYGVVHDKIATKMAFSATPDPNHSAQVNKVHAESWTSKDAYFKKPGNLGAGLSIENGLAIQTVNSGLETQLVKMQLEEGEEEKPRKSLEVFGSPIMEKRSKSLSFDKRLTIPSRDAAPKLEEIDFSEIPCGNYNDAASDASSDLFEIESLTGKSNPFLARQNSDVASGCVTPTTGYAPSEASIEWSVVTASAADYSVMSDFDEQRSVTAIRSPPRAAFTSSNGKIKANKEMQRRSPSSLLGCKSHKAVRVAGDAFITYEKPSSDPQIRRRSDTFLHASRLQEETKLGNLGPRNGQQHAYATKPMQRSYSQHTSQFLYI